MKVKVENVVVGIYDYDSILVKIDNKDVEVVFRKEDEVSQYEGKEIELVNDGGAYKIKPVIAFKKND